LIASSDLGVITEKLILLRQYLGELSEIKDITFNYYMGNKIVKRGAERLLQLLVEVASDINGALLTMGDKTPPESYYESFIKAGKAGLIPDQLAKRLAPSSGLRNRIVHEYGEYKDSIVYKNIKSIHKNYSDYLRSINNYLQKKKI